MSIAPFTGPAAPFIAAAAAIAGPVISMFGGCGQTCIASSTYANQAETALAQIVAQYQALPVHYQSAQQAALTQIQNIFNALRQACSNPSLGAAGQRCISERLVQGGSAPWCPTGTGCDWITAYYLPILNDPSVVPDPSPLSAVGTSSPVSALGTSLQALFPAATAAGVPIVDLLLPGALILWAVLS